MKIFKQLHDSLAASSSEIVDALKNEELQKLIRNIDCSADAESVSTIVMLVSFFRSLLFFAPIANFASSFLVKVAPLLFIAVTFAP